MEGYTFLMQNYRPGDRICIFGMCELEFQSWIVDLLSDLLRILSRCIYGPRTWWHVVQSDFKVACHAEIILTFCLDLGWAFIEGKSPMEA
jgi:hypothetical protein